MRLGVTNKAPSSEDPGCESFLDISPTCTTILVSCRCHDPSGRCANQGSGGGPAKSTPVPRHASRLLEELRLQHQHALALTDLDGVFVVSEVDALELLATLEGDRRTLDLQVLDDRDGIA